MFLNASYFLVFIFLDQMAVFCLADQYLLQKYFLYLASRTLQTSGLILTIVFTLSVFFVSSCLFFRFFPISPILEYSMVLFLDLVFPHCIQSSGYFIPSCSFKYIHVLITPKLYLYFLPLQ